VQKIFKKLYETKKHLINRLSKFSKSNKQPETVLLIDSDGFSYYTCYLARGLSKYLNVILYSFSNESFNTTGAVRERGIKFYNIKKRLPKRYSTIRGIIRVFLLFFILLRALTGTKYDVVHIQDYFPTFFLFIPLLKLRRKQICWTLHDLQIFNFGIGLNGKLQKIFLKIVSQPAIMLRHADKIIIHASSLRDQLIEKKVDENKIFVIPFFDYQYLLEHVDSNKELKSYDFRLDAGYVLFLGNIAPWKGIDTLIDAARLVRNKLGEKFQLVIAGESYPGFRNIQFYNINNEDCKFIKIINKFITSDEIPSLVSKSSFLVLPYNNLFQHSASGVIPLAYTFAKPVVVSNLPSLVEYVDQGKTGLVFDIDNIKQLADCMIYLIENSTQCKEMGQKAYQKIVSELSLDICSRTTYEIYTNHKNQN
jgi:glycosyltransferase involved in cell wall biosynthesis